MPSSPKFARRRKLRRLIAASACIAFSTNGAFVSADQPKQTKNQTSFEEASYFGTDQRLPESELARIDRNVSLLESDSAVIRRLTADRLYSKASSGDAATCEAILCRLRGLRVSFSLETRQLANQLVERIRLACHQQSVAALSPSPWGDSGDILDRELDQWWQQFSQRAGDDKEAIGQFQLVALTAGPDWHWNAAVATQDAQTGHEDWSCLLGIKVPDCGIRYVPAAKKLQTKLLATCPNSIGNCTSTERVVGRLIDSTIRRNPYGWSRETCLGIALTHQRSELVTELSERIWDTPGVRVRELALSLLAADRMNHDGLTERLTECLNDQRVITVLPGQAHFGVGEADWPHSIVVPRISDVAQYLLWKREGVDARQHGMTAIQADPVWGVRLESIGR